MQNSSSMESDSNIESELEAYAIDLSDDMTFPKQAQYENMIKLENETQSFVATLILKHETQFYEIITKNFDCQYEKYLGNTASHIIQMIVEITNKYFNDLYFDIQNKVDNDVTQLVHKMCSYGGYGPHILLDKLIRLVIDSHIEISREKLVCDDTYESFKQSLFVEINIYLSSKDIIHIMAKGINDDTMFIHLSSDQKPFDIVIDKNIEKILN